MGPADAVDLLLEREDPDGRLTGNGRYEGYIKDLMDEMARLQGFKYRLLPPPPGTPQYGMKNNVTGRWSGVVGMVQSNVSPNQTG